MQVVIQIWMIFQIDFIFNRSKYYQLWTFHFKVWLWPLCFKEADLFWTRLQLGRTIFFIIGLFPCCSWSWIRVRTMQGLPGHFSTMWCKAECQTSSLKLYTWFKFLVTARCNLNLTLALTYKFVLCDFIEFNQGKNSNFRNRHWYRGQS